MLSQKQALNVLREEKEYEEKMFAGLVETSLKELKSMKISNNDKKEIESIMKVMKDETIGHEKTIDELIDYVAESGKDDF